MKYFCMVLNEINTGHNPHSNEDEPKTLLFVWTMKKQIPLQLFPTWIYFCFKI